MDGLIVAHVVHVLAVVAWIGGVAFVTTTLLPALRRLPAEDAIRLFDLVERRFGWQARGTTLLTGASGLYMTEALDAWDRFADPGFWWMHAMLLLWLVFTLLLFVAEPLFLHRWFVARAAQEPIRTLRLLFNLHCMLLLAAAVTLAGAVAGSHGWI